MIKKSLKYGCFLALIFAQQHVLAQGDIGLTTSVTNVTHTFTSFAKLITAGSYLVGLWAAFVSVLKFKTYRDAPEKEKLSVPVSYLLVAIAFLFLPYITQQAADTIFGGHATAGSIDGSTNITDM